MSRILPRSGRADVIMKVVLDDFDGTAVAFAEEGGGEDLGFGSVGENGTVFEKNHAVDFGNDLPDLMGDKEESGALSGKVAEGGKQTPGSGEIERGAGFVQDQQGRSGGEGAREETANFFTGGKGGKLALGETGHPGKGQGTEGGIIFRD